MSLANQLANQFADSVQNTVFNYPREKLNEQEKDFLLAAIKNRLDEMHYDPHSLVNIISLMCKDQVTTRLW